MTDFERIDAAELRRRFPDDETAALVVPDDAIVLTDGTGWTSMGVWGLNERDYGGFVNGLDPTAAVAAISPLAEAEGHDAQWLTVERGTELVLPPGYVATGSGSWDLMATTSLLDDATPADVELLELDDVADAEEIVAFAKPPNPDWHGQPGTGETLLWLGIRDDAGALVGVGALEQVGPTLPSGSRVPHAAGLVVDASQRGRGLGRALIVELTRRALAESGVCTLGVYAGNDNAIALYRGIGYHRVRANETTDFERAQAG